MRAGVIGAIGGATLALGLVTTTTSATQPANQACLGEDISSYAQGGPDFGAFISDMATTTGGAGDEVQAHLAGAVPDTVLPNSCND